MTGTVVRVAPDIDAETRTAGCYIALESGEEGSLLRPGAFVRSEIPGLTYEGVIAVPREAFVDGLVFVVRDGRARVVTPVVGRTLPDVVLVEQGLAEGDEVIITNLETLFDGLPVDTGSGE